MKREQSKESAMMSRAMELKQEDQSRTAAAQLKLENSIDRII